MKYKHIICSDCNNLQPHAAKGLCFSCYQRTRRQSLNPPKKITVCVECNQPKPAGRGTLCTKCRCKLYYKQRSDHIKQKQKQSTDKRRKENMAYLNQVIDLKCEICGYNENFVALDFHHRDSTKKNGRNDSMTNWLNYKNLEDFKKIVHSGEWQILCANCHRILHHTS